MASGLGPGACNGLTYYGCTPTWLSFPIGEVIFQIDTYNMLPADTLRIEILTTEPIFVFTALDTDSLLTYGGVFPSQNCDGVCIENWPAGRQLFVVMDWQTEPLFPWTLMVNCLEDSSPGETCEDAIPISGFGQFTTGFCTAGHRDDYSAMNCMPGQFEGADIVYEVCVAPGTQIFARLEDQCAWNSALYLFTDCDDPLNSCVASGVDFMGPGFPSPFQIAWGNGTGAPLTVYIGVDNVCWGPDPRGFGYRGTLEVTWTPCPPPPPPGACCLGGGLCEQTTQAECLQLGGIFKGVGVPCDPNPCTGACCLPSGQCVTTDADQCAQAQGEFMGVNVLCTPTLCPTAGVPEIGGDSAVRIHDPVPNPFFASTELGFTLATPGEVSLGIYDAAGRLVRTLYRGAAPAGLARHAWNGRDSSGRIAAPGVYYARLVAGGRTLSRPLLRVE